MMTSRMRGSVRASASSLLFVLLLTTSQITGLAKSKNKIDGDWEGSIDNGKYPMIFHIRLDAASTVDSPSQAIHGTPTFVNFEGKTLRITIPGAVASYEGQLEGSRIVGTFTQTGSKWPMTLSKVSKKRE